jgi:nucleotide-binding universal stress UspA family protein
MVREILVAIDFSAASERALAAARDYARTFGARLHLLHVVPPTTDPRPSPGLEALAASIRDGLTVETAVTAGLPAAQIVRYAERRGVDLVVVGTHGRTGVTRALLGSVAEAVVRSAPCPVLTVPQAPGAVAAPAAAGEAVARPCIVCAGPSGGDLICAGCRAHIRGEAVEHKQREERAGRR